MWWRWRRVKLLECCSSLSADLRRCSQRGVRPGARILLASALLAQSQLPAARQLIVAAIREAAPEGFCRPFLDHARQSNVLLTLARETATLPSQAHAWMRDVLRLIEHTAEGADLPPGEVQALTIAATISAREYEVLQLVSKGLSNRSIAAHLSLAASTVKSHLDTIYRKLSVHSRTQALTAARALRSIFD